MVVALVTRIVTVNLNCVQIKQHTYYVCSCFDCNLCACVWRLRSVGGDRDNVNSAEGLESLNYLFIYVFLCASTIGNTF